MPRLLLVLLLAAPAAAADPGFRLTLDPKAHAGPVSGRAFVLLLSVKPNPLPRGLNWFSPEPAFAVDVKDWKPGEPLDLGPKALATVPPAEVKAGKYWMVAVLDRDLGGISFAASAGNLHSEPRQVDFDPGAEKPLAFTLDRVYSPPEPADTDTVKFVGVESRLLTRFHGKPTTLRAGVILPPSFAAEPDRKYPVVFEIPGFGGDHTVARIKGGKAGVLADGVEAVWVVLDPNCRLGHHVFADSANNGPVGAALVEELVPFVEGRFRCGGEPGRRLVTGHSSGGWSSLWLQVTHPDVFGGCWSTSPDPVDFRDFQRVNLYRDANLFTDSGGNPRPLSRPRGGRTLGFKPFSDMERVMGRGGQLGSFEAVFGPRGPDGKPRPLWDRDTGAIDQQTARAWEKYDIRRVLERGWPALGPKLAGKVHVWMGDEDTFLLDGAARLLRKSLADLGGDAVVELFPGRDHGLVDVKLRERMKAEMATRLRRTD